ncbi:hypothetical protein HZS_5142 [Henneguya salminicola]|nr:hypothetical protein HZS_5142 [Henneguya salminicola]
MRFGPTNFILAEENIKILRKNIPTVLKRMRIDKKSEISRLLEANITLEVLKDPKINILANDDIKKGIFGCHVHKLIIEYRKQHDFSGQKKHKKKV